MQIHLSPSRLFIRIGAWSVQSRERPHILDSVAAVTLRSHHHPARVPAKRHCGATAATMHCTAAQDTTTSSILKDCPKEVVGPLHVRFPPLFSRDLIFFGASHIRSFHGRPFYLEPRSFSAAPPPPRAVLWFETVLSTPSSIVGRRKIARRQTPPLPPTFRLSARWLVRATPPVRSGRTARADLSGCARTASWEKETIVHPARRHPHYTTRDHRPFFISFFLRRTLCRFKHGMLACAALSACLPFRPCMCVCARAYGVMPAEMTIAQSRKLLSCSRDGEKGI